MIVNIPFEGFYYSKYDQELGLLQEQEVEYGDHDYDQDAYSDALWRHTDHGKAYEEIAQAYVRHFNAYVEQETGLDLGLKFHRLVSPREYNFTTDRIDCVIELKNVFDLAFAKDWKDLKATIKERHTPYDGFISFYSNDPEVWKSKPYADWDHNELGTLLRAFMKRLPEDWEWTVFYRVQEEISDIWEGCVDWQAVEDEMKEAQE